MPTEMNRLIGLMARLRAPDGCPWDRKQTHESLKPYLLEETYEVLEAIDHGEPASLKEELGDLLLQILFHAQIASERSHFTINEVAESLATKLIRRHPHVFEKDTKRGSSLDAQQVLHQWEAIKNQERSHQDKNTSLLEGIPKSSPALQRAHQVQGRASRAGFDWAQPAPVFEKLQEEFEELFTAVAQLGQNSLPQGPSEDHNPFHAQVEAELGDVLFSLVNIARFLKVNPEEALRKATNKFIDRFSYIETRAALEERPLSACSEVELDQWWEEAKAQERPLPDKEQPTKDG